MTCALRGVHGIPVQVEADVENGLPHVTVVGMTDRAIQEARERVRAAVRNSGYEFPRKRVTINLAPAELPKEGTGLDLAMAMAVLQANGRHELRLGGIALIGELALDGTVRPVNGVLAMARGLRAAGVRRLLVPRENGEEAALVEGTEVVAAGSLAEALQHLDGTRPLPTVQGDLRPVDPRHGELLGEVRGQQLAKRALEIAAAGGHNLLMVGPPGVGKTMLARALADLLPPLHGDDVLEVAALYSLKGALTERPAMSVRPPFRAPHHSVSRAGLIGGGSGLAQPGEASLAHRGVLLLDELLEFQPQLLEALRQPLEERTVVVARSRGAVRFPADFTLVAASNPCRCGYLGDERRSCTCSELEVQRYRSRLSGPLRDRLDLVVHVPRPRFSDLFTPPAGADESPAVAQRVDAARLRQHQRHAQDSRFAASNARLRAASLTRATALDAATRKLLRQAGERLQLSARGYHRVLRVARTIADLDGHDRVDEAALAEALRYRTEVPV